jgi:hypothetical protein
MNAYYAEVRKLEAHFEGLEFHNIFRDNNVAADVLSKLGSKRALVPAGVFVQDLRKPSIRLLNDPETSHNDTPPPSSRDVLMVEAEDDLHFNFITYIVVWRNVSQKARSSARKSSGAALTTSSSALSYTGGLPPMAC